MKYFGGTIAHGLFAVLIAAVGGAAESHAQRIAFDHAARVLYVVGFDEDNPATLSALHAADQSAGWDVVRRLPEGAGYGIRASLWIGDDSGASTYFAIGGARRPAEELRIAGDLWVRPSADSAVNRLTAGDPDMPDARSLIGIHCEEPQQYGLVVGDRGGVHRGELVLYHTDVRALAEPLRGGMSPRGSGGWYGNRIELIGCRIAGIEDRATYGTGTRNAVMREVVFENCGWVFSLGDRVVEGIVMRGNRLALDRAVGTYIDCRLEENEQDIVWPSQGAIFWIDSGTGAAGPPSGRESAVTVEQRELPDEAPVLMEFRRMIFEGSDAGGRAVSGAKLAFEPTPADRRAVQAVPPVLTDAQGRTPGDLHLDAVLLARARWHRAEDGRMVRVPYRYRVRVASPEGEIVTVELDDDDLGRPGVREVLLTGSTRSHGCT